MFSAYPAGTCNPIYMDLPDLCTSLSPDGGVGDYTNAVKSCRINGGTLAKLGTETYYKTGKYLYRRIDFW